MEKIALSFQLELQGLIDRYKNRLSVPHIMNIVQDVFHKNLIFKHNPGLHSKAINYFLQGTEYDKPEIKPGDEHNAFSGPNAICSQGRDGCCIVYKFGWDNCRGCPMYHGV